MAQKIILLKNRQELTLDTVFGWVVSEASSNVAALVVTDDTLSGTVKELESVFEF